MFSGLKEWLVKRFGTSKQTHVNVVLDKVQYYKSMRAMICKCASLDVDVLFKRVHSATHAATMDELFAIHLQYSVTGDRTVGFGSCAMGQLTFVCEGSVLAIGVHNKALQGYSYKSKQESLNNLIETDFNQFIAHGSAFVMKMGPGDVLVAPPNWHCIYTSLEPSFCLKNAYIDQEKPVFITETLSAAMQIVASYSALAQGQMAELIGWLQERQALLTSGRQSA